MTVRSWPCCVLFRQPQPGEVLNASKPLAQVRYPPERAFLINFERLAVNCRRQLYVKVGFVLRLPPAKSIQALFSKWCEKTQCFLFQPIRTKAKRSLALSDVR